MQETRTRKQAAPGESSGAGERLYGVNPERAVAAIKGRVERMRAGEGPADGRKLALVVEGGAMRGVCSAGGVAALAHLGFTELFDEVYATSAGAMNASYFLSGQPASGISIYFDDCTTRLFINPLRFWKLIDIDYLFDRVVTAVKPLDVGRVLASRTKLFVAVIDKRTGEGRVIDTRATKAPLLSVLKAATAVPIFYNRTVEVDGSPYMDAGLAIPFPLEQALANGCTDILVLTTRPPDFITERPGWLARRMFDAISARGLDGMSHTFASHHVRVQGARDLALGRAPTPPGVNVATVCTDPSETVRRTTVNRERLRAGAVRYARKVLRAFGADAEDWDLSALSDARPRS
jgi:predicted patatin/cPLA2 family phospholipase